MKKIVSLMLAVVILAMAFPAMAITNDRANAYFKILDGLGSREIYGANSYLVDFDGDGNEELIVLYGDFSPLYDTCYEVYSGEKMLVQKDFDGFIYTSLCTKDGSNKFYLHAEPVAGDAATEEFYTVENGEWIKETSTFIDWWKPETVYYINGVVISKTEYDREMARYKEYADLTKRHTAYDDIYTELDITIQGYEDIYSKLTAEEKDLIFEDFLNDIAFAAPAFSTQTVTDEEFVQLLADVRMDTDFSAFDKTLSAKDFTALTQRYFGRTIDYSKFAIDHEPTGMDTGYRSVYYNGTFYLMWPQRGSSIEFETNMGDDMHLYSLGNDSYYASFKLVNHGTYDPGIHGIYGVFGAVIKKNSDGTYRLVRIGLPMTVAEIEAAVNPSDWAKAEIASAEAAGLVPELDSAPVWKDKATRLQFAQLAVNLAEKVTGKEIAAAPESTFEDCSDTAVLKAFNAGIINGTSESEFSPYASLTREQLATMIWRTVNYIQKETKKEKLSAGGDVSGYTDASAVSDYAREAVAALAKNDIMKGTSDTELSPKGSCTVEQSVVLMYRLYNRVK